MTMPESEMKRVAKEAADETVKSTFRALGVDLSDQQQLNDFRNDLVWARRNRRLHEQVGGRALLTIVSVLTGAFLLAGWELIRTKIGLG